MKASILTANYNCERYLRSTIMSVMEQDYSDLEMVIVDDHSKDKSKRLIRKLARRDSRIRLIDSPKRLKCGGAYNLALNEAQGEICCVLDADDVLNDKKSLKRVVRKYESNDDIGYIWTQFYICDPNLHKLRKGSSANPGKFSMLEAGLAYNKYRHCFSHWRTMRTCLRDRATIFKPGLPAAVDKWMGYVLEELAPGGFYPKALYKYRQRVGGLSYTGRKHWKRMLQEFKQKRDAGNITPYPIRTL